jgi:hypothetical protein
MRLRRTTMNGKVFPIAKSREKISMAISKTCANTFQTTDFHDGDKFTCGEKGINGLFCQALKRIFL